MSTNTHSSTFDKIFFILYVIVLLFAVRWMIAATSIPPQPMSETQVVKHQPSVAPLWGLSGVHLMNSSKPPIAASDNKLILLAYNNVAPREGVIALDATSGKLVWEEGRDIWVMIIVDSSVIAGGLNRVYAFDIQNGNTLWSHFGTKLDDITPMGNGLVYVYGSAPRDYVIDPSTGKILKRPKFGSEIEYDPSVASFGNITYTYGGRDVQAVNRASDQTLWTTPVKGIISNLAVTVSAVYALSQDGSLLRIDGGTGEISKLISFTSAPFTGVRGYYQYYVVVDTRSNILFAYLGDSAELYAFQLPISSP